MNNLNFDKVTLAAAIVMGASLLGLFILTGMALYPLFFS